MGFNGLDCGALFIEIHTLVDIVVIWVCLCFNCGCCLRFRFGFNLMILGFLVCGYLCFGFVWVYCLLI